MPRPRTVPTIGTIAESCGVPVHRVRYVIQSRRIRPSGWAGNARVFTAVEVAVIRAEIARIAEQKGVTNADRAR